MIMIAKLGGFKDILVRLVRLPGVYIDLNWAVLRRFWFSLLFISIVWAKVLHIYSHLNSLPWQRFLLWCPTFFVQDAVCIVIAWVLTLNYSWTWFRILAALLVIPTTLGISSMSAANTSFFVTTGAEIHWRQAGNLMGDVAAFKMLLTGLTGMLITDMIFFAASWCATPCLHNGVGDVFRTAGEVLGILASFVTPWFRLLGAFLVRHLRTLAAPLIRHLRQRKILPDPEAYEQVPRDDYRDDYLYEDRVESDPPLFEGAMGETEKTSSYMRKRYLILAPIAAVLLLDFFRPADASYTFLSQTLPLAPFDNPKSRSGHTLVDIGLPSELEWLNDRTALSVPHRLDWLPPGNWAGFKDWQDNTTAPENRRHYDPVKDPLHISNLKGDIIAPLRDILHSGNVKIKHVILIKMESTRPDVFPFRKDSYLHDRIRKSYGRNGIPSSVEKRLAKFTRTSERLTGIPSGFQTAEEPFIPYGGIRATNSYTASTYTLKSLEATLCGVVPLVADFNVDYQYHIYQPCMPQIIDALSAHYNHTPRTNDFTSWPWNSGFMQSVTDTYDNQHPLTEALGFKDIVSKDSITSDLQGNSSTETEEISNWGYPDDDLRTYFRNAIENAEHDRQRLFITYLTGISHHPWHMRQDKFDEFVGSQRHTSNDHLNRYLNTIGFMDKWYEELFGILEETGIANETLVVMTGDHGTSLAENGGVTPYDNPHVSNFHVPLLFSHPRLPPIELDSPVTSLQILPTILDLLKETSSVDDYTLHAIKDLLPMYEGQSMIRPLIREIDGMQDWQFTVMNTGGTWLSVRSATRPYRLVMPLVSDLEWRFSDIERDPKEKRHLLAFDLWTLIDLVRVRSGDEAVDWIHNATHVGKWWVHDNWRRYEYT